MQNFKTNLFSKKDHAMKYVLLLVGATLFGSYTLADAKCPRLHSGQTFVDLNAILDCLENQMEPSSPASLSSTSSPEVAGTKSAEAAISRAEMSKTAKDFKFSVLKLEREGSTIRVHFEIANGASGKGSFGISGEGGGNGYSKLIANRKQYRAAEVVIGDSQGKQYVHKPYYSGAPETGYIVFNGIPTDLSKIDVLVVGYMHRCCGVEGEFNFDNLDIP
jgi:hypothetical protein